MFLTQPQKKRKKERVRIRKEVYERDDYACRYCGKSMKEGYLLWKSTKGAKRPEVGRKIRLHSVGISADHVVPKSKGGEFTVENLVTCCRNCNGRKGSMSLEEFINVTNKNT